MVKTMVLLPVSLLSVVAAFALPRDRETFTISSSPAVAAVAADAAVHLADHLPAMELRTSLLARGDALVDLVAGVPGSALALDLDPADLPLGLEAVPIAVRGLVFVAHPHRHLTDLSGAQVASLLGGGLTNWAELGGPDTPIRLLLPASVAERELVMTDLGLTGEAAVRATCANDARCASLVAGDPFAIGCMSITAAEAAIAAGAPLQVLGLDGEQPSGDRMRHGDWPLVHRLSVVSNTAESGMPARLLDYLQSEAGLEMLQTHGFEPL
ncbi:MAG: substrate-binding domain-containing protein [Planctomycetota bacterium]